MTEATNIKWRPSGYKSSPLCVGGWCDKEGWDFVGSVVDIQLRHALLDEGLGDWSAGEFFWVKYTGTMEGFELNAEHGKIGDRVNYHFGVEKFSKELIIFRDVNIFDCRNHLGSGVRDIEAGLPLKQEESIEEQLAKAGFFSNRGCVWGCH
jgi:hypothetical protein